MAGEACCKPAPPAEHTGQGVEGMIGGMRAYLNKPAAAVKAVILAMDVFGIDLPLVRKLADKTAAAGFYAVVPDFFNGDPYVAVDPNNLFAIANFGPWIAKHHPDVSVDANKNVIKELKEQGFESVGCSGFCWGGRLAVMTAQENSLLKAIVLLHTSLTTKENIEGVKSAIAILGAENDVVTPPALVQEFKQILDGKPEIPSFVKIFEGQQHGWSNRYDVNIPHQVKGAEEAQANMLEFYKKHM